MANENELSTSAENIGENVADIVSTATEGIVESAENALENAEARIEQAEKVAEAITDAALQTAIGQRVSEIEGNVLSWLDGRDARERAMQDQLSQLASSLEEMKTLMILQPSSPPTPTPQETVAPLIPDLSEEAEAIIVEPVTAMLNGPGEEDGPQVQKPVRKRRFL